MRRRTTTRSTTVGSVRRRDDDEEEEDGGVPVPEPELSVADLLELAGASEVLPASRMPQHRVMGQTGIIAMVEPREAAAIPRSRCLPYRHT